MAATWSKRTVLRAGYGAVIAVLVLSTVEAYRIQVGVSRQHLEIYRHFVEQEEALSTLRRNLWLAGNHVRDFFIRNTPEQGAELVPRRGELYNALREVTLADQQMLANSEGEFAGTRRRAAAGLLLMLGLGVLLSVTVTRISLRHADNLERAADRHFAAVEQAKQ